MRGLCRPEVGGYASLPFLNPFAVVVQWQNVSVVWRMSGVRFTTAAPS